MERENLQRIDQHDPLAGAKEARDVGPSAVCRVRALRRGEARPRGSPRHTGGVGGDARRDGAADV